MLNRSLSALLILMSVAAADDWPQWMGPNRDNVWRESGIITRFPAGGPKVLWRTPIAGGYAGPAVADGKVFIADYVTKDNVKQGWKDTLNRDVPARFEKRLLDRNCKEPPITPATRPSGESTRMSS